MILTTELVLFFSFFFLFDHTHPIRFIQSLISTDASEDGLGAVLLQAVGDS